LQGDYPAFTSYFWAHKVTFKSDFKTLVICKINVLIFRSALSVCVNISIGVPSEVQYSVRDQNKWYRI